MIFVLQGMKRLEARGSRELTESTHRMTLGLQMFVKQALDMFLSGTNLQRLQLQQRVGGLCLMPILQFPGSFPPCHSSAGYVEHRRNQRCSPELLKYFSLTEVFA